MLLSPMEKGKWESQTLNSLPPEVTGDMGVTKSVVCGNNMYNLVTGIIFYISPDDLGS